MKLSEAIRLGSLIRPQVFEAFFENLGSCALGAAAEAIGVKYTPDPFSLPLLDKTFGLLFRQVPPCRECPAEFWCDSVKDRIIHLNDCHHWTRERIADWVEHIEREQEAAKKPAAEEEVAICL